MQTTRHPERSCGSAAVEGPAVTDSGCPIHGAVSPRHGSRTLPLPLWTALALAVLTKGLVAIVFLFATASLYLALTGELRNWRRLKPFSGALLFLAIAAPWHILAGLRNTGGLNGHGFFWFYFINEHVLRFLGRRIPRDYNKLPSYPLLVPPPRLALPHEPLFTAARTGQNLRS